MATQFTPSQIKLEATDSGENITEIQNYLDTFNKEIEGGDGTATISAVAGQLHQLCKINTYRNILFLHTGDPEADDGEDGEEGTYFIDQSGHYYYQASSDQQPVMAVVSGTGDDDEEFVINPDTEEGVIDGDEVCITFSKISFTNVYVYSIFIKAAWFRKETE